VCELGIRHAQVVKGLDLCGEKEYAAEIARRYCNACVESSFPENF
jgi:hypothetical protein